MEKAAIHAIGEGSGIWCLALGTATLPPFTATNAYILAGGGEAYLVDPGSGTAEDMEGIVAGLQRAGVTRLLGILLTHPHSDHTGGIRPVRQRYGVPVRCHPATVPGLRLGVGEDVAVCTLEDGEVLQAGPLTIEALHTPGHASGHLSFWLPQSRVLLSGDNILGEGTTAVGPPDGEMKLYLESLQRYLRLDMALIAPAHGPVVTEPARKVQDVYQHRLEREQQVLALLAEGPRRRDELRQRIYGSLGPEQLNEAARRTVLAHLIKLEQEGRVQRTAAGDEGPFALKA